MNVTEDQRASRLPAHVPSAGPPWRNICIVSSPQAAPGPDHFAPLPFALAKASHAVTLLATDRKTNPKNLTGGVRLELLPDDGIRYSGPDYLALSYRVFQWLRRRSFDLVYFNEWPGTAYYSLLARHQGLALESTAIGLGIHQPTLWTRETNRQFIDNIDDLERDAIERRCALLAGNHVWVPNPDLQAWLISQDWKFPRTGGVCPPSLPVSENPLVSVCLVHFNRPKLLDQALDSLRKQDYPRLELIVLDDGSTDPTALDRLATLSRGGGVNPPLLVVRQENRYLGAARNAAARRARGSFLLFMDDDNVARPHEISTLVRVARNTGADIVTSLWDTFTGPNPPRDKTVELALVSGLHSPACIVRNCYGDANALVRREVFHKLGGFTEDRGVTHEDWEFFARAALHGHRLEMVPEPLFWYRLTPESMIRTTPAAANFARHLRPFLEEAPPFHRDMIRLAQGLALKNLKLEAERNRPRPLRYKIADTLNRCFKKLVSFIV